MPKSETSLSQLLYDIRRIAEHREKLTEKKIAAIYNSLIKELNAYIADEYVKYADKDGRLYISSLDAKRHRATFLREIMTNVDSVSPAIKEEMETLIDVTYSKCYEGMVKALKKANADGRFAEVTKDLTVRPEVLKQAINNNISKLTLPPLLDRYRNEVVYQIQQELNIGLMNGDRYEQMANRIADRVGVSKSKAMNIARTETHRNIESGFMDCAERLSKGLEGSDLIYAATWRTMKDERVRPQQRRKTKSGWKTTLSRSGANHQVMEGQTVKVGEDFDLGYYSGRKVTAKAPSKSGVAAHDCNCRCFLEYNLMTVEEFAKATNQTPEEVRKKYEMSEPIEDTVKEKDLTNNGNDVTIELPKSLENFDDYQQKWVDTHFAMRAKDKEIVQKGIQSVIDNNAYSIRVNAKNLQSIIDDGFLNQFETKTSGGTLSNSDRRIASYRLFGNDAMHMEKSEFEKYGYLGSKDFLNDALSSATSQYGKTIVKFNKDRLKDRVTYTIDDSLGNALYNEVIGGKIGDECSISGVPIFNMDDVLDYFKESDLEDIYNADEFAQVMGCRYFELQYHGKLTIDDVDSICFTGRDNPTDEILKQLKDKGIKVYKIKGGKVNEM